MPPSETSAARLNDIFGSRLRMVAEFGKDTALGRAGQPEEVAACYLFLASDEASYMTGQFLHPNGGRIVNG